MRKKENDSGKIIPSGPLKGKRLIMTSQEGIDHYDDLVHELIDRIFNIKAFFISDESSLWDFCDFGQADKKKQQAVFTKIHELYGVDCRDIQNGNLLAICQRISRLSLHTPQPKERH